MQFKSKNNQLVAILMKSRYFVILLFIPFVFSCGNKPPVEDLSSNYSDDDGFDGFYERFHKDSVFQMERITFPLQGLPGMADSMLVNYGEYHYKKAGWRLLHHIEWDTVTNFQRVLEPTGLGVVNEYICTIDKFCISRRFAKLSNGWHLIYYADINYRPDL
ncbi:MAG: hypothetical protein ACI94Y_001844 [Maribacter sp.]|jgi:hypothetical protein